MKYQKDHLDYSPRMMVSIYYGSKLFIDGTSALTPSDLVFGVLLPEFFDKFEGPLYIYFLKAKNLHYDCSYWNFNESTIGSWIIESTSYSHQTALCEFMHLTNFAMPTKFLGLLGHDALISTPYNEIYPTITQEHLNATEIELVSEFIEPNTSLQLLTHDVMIKINDEHDKILYNIDYLLKKFNYTIQFEVNNVIFIIISNEDLPYFEGLSITKKKIVNCIFKHHNQNFEDVDVIIDISDKLKDQIKTAQSSMVFSLFFDDALFPTSEGSKIELPIVEVLLPNINGQLNGDIQIRYKNAFQGACSFWDHHFENNQLIRPGNWQKEGLAEVDKNGALCQFNHVTHFALITSSNNITNDLEEILSSNLTGLEKLEQVETITTANHDNLAPIDIFLISQIITNSFSEGVLPLPTSKIISTLFMVPRNVLRDSQKTHSATDIMLYAVDKMAEMLNDLDMHLANFSLIVKNLDNFKLTGLILQECKEFECTVDYLDKFVNISEISSNKSIDSLVLFDEKLINQLKSQSGSPKIAISIYYSDVLFNEANQQRKTTKIFGIVFPGLSADLEGSVSVIYNIGSRSRGSGDQCAYWHYQVNPSGNIKNATLGTWLNDTHKERLKSMAICSYSHVTHFGMLLANNDAYDEDPILDLITDVGCVLSLFGILVIFFTATVFKKWRQNTGNKILVNFSIAISLKIIALYVSVYIKTKSSGIVCTVTGIILHYAILSECGWMLTVAILQFKRFVEVLGGPPKYVLVKALICGWIFPIIPVVCVIAIDPSNYEEGVANICYPSNLGLFLGVWLPVLIILTINCIIFIFIIYNVFHKKTEYIDTSNQDILFQWRLALLLFFMLGLNWAFGFLGQIKEDILFTYLYSVTASLQGFVLFLFFILFNKSTRFLYSQSIKKWFYVRGIFKVWQSQSKTR